MLAKHDLLQAILKRAPVGIWMSGPDGKLKFANQLFCNAVGVAEPELKSGMRYTDALPSSISGSFIQSDRECYEQESTHVSRLWLHFAKGHDHQFEFTRVKLFDREGSLLGLIGLAADINDCRQTEDKLRLTFKVFENMQEGVTINDANGNVLHINTAFSRITGYSRDELVGKNLRILQSGHQSPTFYQSLWQAVATEGHWSGELWNLKKGGELYAEWLSISAIKNDEGEVTNYVGVSSDITQFKQHQKQLDHVAHYDTLTGLPNRALLNDRLKQAIARATREHNMMAICYLDLDGFKLVNDTMGHAVGDSVLVQIAQRIQHTIRGGDTVARMGGDEFVVLLLGLERGDECSIALDRLLAVIAEPLNIGGKNFVLGASIGVSIYPLDDEHMDTLLRHADQAMYTAKQAGKNRFHIYDPALDQRARNQQELLKSIQQGLKKSQFELYYQPKVDLHTRAMVGAEALIRWNHPEQGLLTPARFLPAVENTELDIEIGEWVIATALQQISQWQAGGRDIEVSINISAHHLESANFAGKLQQQLARYPGISPARLQIEVLETSSFEDIENVRLIIESCTRLGVCFALDDFGTGYSSLSYLSRLPVNTLKIDQSFVRNLTANKGDYAIVLGIIALSHAFELKTVAEGIETQEHFDTLLKMDCDIGQGYFIARPMRAVALLDWSKQAAPEGVENLTAVSTRTHKMIELLHSLPPMPKIAQEILAINLANDEGDELLLKLIVKDPAIFARIIGLANSPLFGSSRQILAMSDAASVLGIRRIKMISLGFAMTASLSRKPSGILDAVSLWKHSMAVALGMDVLAKAMPRKARPSDDEIYLAGLLHDIGYLVLDYVDPELSNRFHLCIAEENASVAEIEAQMLEMNHGELGALLAEHWDLPPNIIAVIRYHHQEGVAIDAAGQPLIAMTSLVEKLLPTFGFKEPVSQEIGIEQWQALGIEDEQVDEISAAIRKCAEEAAQALI